MILRIAWIRIEGIRIGGIRYVLNGYVLKRYMYVWKNPATKRLSGKNRQVSRTGTWSQNL